MCEKSGHPEMMPTQQHLDGEQRDDQCEHARHAGDTADRADLDDCGNEQERPETALTDFVLNVTNRFLRLVIA